MNKERDDFKTIWFQAAFSCIQVSENTISILFMSTTIH